MHELLLRDLVGMIEVAVAVARVAAAAEAVSINCIGAGVKKVSCTEVPEMEVKPYYPI